MCKFRTFYECFCKPCSNLRKWENSLLFTRNFNRADVKQKGFLMNATRRIKIRVEKHELKIVRFGRRQNLFCGICRAEKQHLTVSQVSAVLGISEVSVFRLAASGQVHSTDRSDGKLMICAESMAVLVRK